MFRPFSVYVGLRYTRAKKRNHFISFISLSSMIGIALGVAVLIIVLSVMNGFDQVISQRIFGMASHLTVTSTSGWMPDWTKEEAALLKKPHITQAAPFITGQGLLSNDGFTAPVLLTGILPEREKSMTVLATHVVEGSLNALKPGSFGILIGSELAANLGLKLNDSEIVMTPKASSTPGGIFPVMKRFTVMGIFHVGRGFGYDNQLAFMDLKDAQTLLRYGNNITGIRLRVDNFWKAPLIAQNIQQTLSNQYIVSNWTNEFGALFSAIKLEKTMMFFILLLLVAIAAFNLVSGLVMTVTDKQADIAILRTLGATRGMIVRIFMVQGSLIGLFGTFLGVLLGIVVALHTMQWVNAIEDIFHVQLLSGNIYYVDYLPSRLMLADLLHIGFAAIIMSFLATLYPAWRASHVHPAEALRYE